MNSSFEFTEENSKKLQSIIKRYPQKRAAMLPALHLAQSQAGYISAEVEAHVAEVLEVPIVDVREVVTFYSMFAQEPQGKHHIRLCTSLSCWLRGCEEIHEHILHKLGVEDGGVTADGEISYEAVPDCLGACELAPMLQIDGYFEGNLTREKVDEVLKKKSVTEKCGK